MIQSILTFASWAYQATSYILTPTETDKDMLRCLFNIPCVPTGLALLYAILNLIYPGVGTALTGVSGFEISLLTVTVGVVQFLTQDVYLGWVWSILWASLIVDAAWNPTPQQIRIHPFYSRR